MDNGTNKNTLSFDTVEVKTENLKKLDEDSLQYKKQKQNHWDDNSFETNDL